MIWYPEGKKEKKEKFWTGRPRGYESYA